MTETQPAAEPGAPTPDGSAASSPAGAARPDAVAALEALCATLIEAMRGDPALAASVEAALSGVGAGAAHGGALKPKRKRVEAPADLMELNLAAAMAEQGAIELRDWMSRYTNAELAAFIRAKRLHSDEPPSKLNKTQLLNVIVRSVK